VHRFTDNVLAQYWTQDSTAVSVSRKRRSTAPFQLYIAPDSVPTYYLTQQNGAPITKLRRPAAKLKAGIGHRQRFSIARDAVSRQYLHTLG
jgi:hypothetical protein